MHFEKWCLLCLISLYFVTVMLTFLDYRSIYVNPCYGLWMNIFWLLHTLFCVLVCRENIYVGGICNYPCFCKPMLPSDTPLFLLHFCPLSGCKPPQHQGAPRPDLPDRRRHDHGKDARGDPQDLQHQWEIKTRGGGEDPQGKPVGLWVEEHLGRAEVMHT